MEEPKPPQNFDLITLAPDSTEGATWVDSDASAFRDHIAEQNAKTLRAVIGGLAAKGYAPRATKRDMREEFDEILDGLWSRGSYSSFPEARVIASMMRKAGVRNYASTAHTVSRFLSFSRKYGAGLAVVRLLPDKYLAN